jgi:hypothetical protein
MRCKTQVDRECRRRPARSGTFHIHDADGRGLPVLGQSFMTANAASPEETVNGWIQAEWYIRKYRRRR